MGILKRISSGIEKAERKYHEMEADSRPIRTKAGQAFDIITLAPAKKGGKPVKVAVVKQKCPPCPCSGINKGSAKYKKKR